MTAEYTKKLTPHDIIRVTLLKTINNVMEPIDYNLISAPYDEGHIYYGAEIDINESIKVRIYAFFDNASIDKLHNDMWLFSTNKEIAFDLMQMLLMAIDESLRISVFAEIDYENELVMKYRLGIVDGEPVRKLSKFDTHNGVWYQHFLNAHKTHLEEYSVTKEAPGYVYLVQDLEGNYKIGKSKDPVDRIEKLGVILPSPLETIHLIKSNNYHKAESQLHSQFGGNRKRGEWFALTPAELDYIKSIKQIEYEVVRS